MGSLDRIEMAIERGIKGATFEDTDLYEEDIKDKIRQAERDRINRDRAASQAKEDAGLIPKGTTTKLFDNKIKGFFQLFGEGGQFTTLPVGRKRLEDQMKDIGSRMEKRIDSAKNTYELVDVEEDLVRKGGPAITPFFDRLDKKIDIFVKKEIEQPREISNKITEAISKNDWAGILNLKIPKDVVGRADLIKEKREAKSAIKEGILRDAGFALKGEDMYRSAIRSPNSLIKTYKLRPEEAAVKFEELQKYRENINKPRLRPATKK